MKVVRILFWTVITILALFAAYILAFRVDDVVGGMKTASYDITSDKCVNDNPKIYCQLNNETNPNANYFDQWGNEYDYLGHIIAPAPTCVSGNPLCDTSSPVIDQQPLNFEGK